jgi:hypothetical protein
MKTFIVHLKSDSGIYKIKTEANSIEIAKNNIIKSENCPECVIIKIDEMTDKELQMINYLDSHINHDLINVVSDFRKRFNLKEKESSIFIQKWIIGDF